MRQVLTPVVSGKVIMLIRVAVMPIVFEHIPADASSVCAPVAVQSRVLADSVNVQK